MLAIGAAHRELLATMVWGINSAAQHLSVLSLHPQKLADERLWRWRGTCSMLRPWCAEDLRSY